MGRRVLVHNQTSIKRNKKKAGRHKAGGVGAVASARKGTMGSYVNTGKKKLRATKNLSTKKKKGRKNRKAASTDGGGKRMGEENRGTCEWP